MDLLAVQGTLKSLLQHHSSKASTFQHSAFFTVQLSHPYMTTGKTTALTRRTLVGKVTCLLCNMLTVFTRCHFLALLRKKVQVTQSCPTLCDLMDYTVHGILQARILERVAFPFSRGSSQPRDRTQACHIAGRFFIS